VCDPIARNDTAAAFWQVGFEVQSTTDSARHACPPATAGKVTLCIMPR
jgi:hypothetical protein